MRLLLLLIALLAGAALLFSHTRLPARAATPPSRLPLHQLVPLLARDGFLNVAGSHLAFVKAGTVTELNAECTVWAEPAPRNPPITVLQIFAWLREQLASVPEPDFQQPGTPTVEATYDPVLGYPIRITTDVRSSIDATRVLKIDDLQLIY